MTFCVSRTTINRLTYTRDELSRMNYEKLAHDIAINPYDESLISMTSDIVTDILTITPLGSKEYLWLPLFALVPSNEINETLNSLRPLTSAFPWLYSKIGKHYAVELVTSTDPTRLSTLEEFLVSVSYEKVIVAMVQLINAQNIARKNKIPLVIAEVSVITEDAIGVEKELIRLVILTTSETRASSTNIATILYTVLGKIGRGGDRNVYGLLARIYTTIVHRIYEELPLLIARGYCYEKPPLVIPEKCHTNTLFESLMSLVNYRSDIPNSMMSDDPIIIICPISQNTTNRKAKKSENFAYDRRHEEGDSQEYSREESPDYRREISKYLLGQRPDTYRSFRLAGYVPQKDEENRALTSLTAEITRTDSFSSTESLSLLRTILGDIQWVNSLSDSCNDHTTELRLEVMRFIEEKVERLILKSEGVSVI